MIYTKQYTIGFLSELILITILLGGCNSDCVEHHLTSIHEINNMIPINGWKTKQKSVIGNEYFFSLEKQVVDTTYYFNFYFLKDENKYYIDDLKKSFNCDSLYHEMAIDNKDTLYHFVSKRNPDFNIPNDSMVYFDRLFITGKYYYMYKNGKLKWGQKEFFEDNKDSLVKIRGDLLPPLPNL